MNIRTLIAASLIASLPIAAGAATLVIPAAGTGAGFNGSRWQSELTLHNTSSRTLVLNLAFTDSKGGHALKTITVAPRSTKSLQDVVKNDFGFETATGAIVINISDVDASRLAVTSRTFNVSENGTFGQDIPAYRADEASTPGDTSILSGPSSAVADRFNFGVYAIVDTTVTWRLVRADGTVAASVDVTYPADSQKQYNNGIVTLLGATAGDNDTVYALVRNGKAFFYGSAINQISGDPTFVPAVKARQDLNVNFLGIDLDENGTADLFDANRDGVIDVAMDVITSTFPSFFRVMVSGPNGEPATITVIDSPSAYVLLDGGTIQLSATGDLKGTTANLRVRATAGGESEILTIPVHFK